MSVASQPESERLGAWLANNRRDDESVEAATSRFRTSELRASQALIRWQTRGALAPFVPLVDDGIADAKWARRNPDRRYRVRPWRKIDGEPVTYTYPCFTVFNVIDKRGHAGIPIDALHEIGFPAQPEDSDTFAELVLLAFSASKGFRNMRPGHAG